MMDTLGVVKKLLNVKHIKVPDEWIADCIDFIVSENQGLSVSNTRVLSDKVYEQWLHCDLTQLATCCLPVSLSQQRVTTISGVFTVQVNQIRDIGRPAYTQLQTIQKADNENASVTAFQPHQAAWEPKPSRVLLLQITDGTSVVRGMEHKPIPSLNVNLKPGTKLLLSGKIVSRRGTLLLQQEHVRVLGGEVEDMLKPNAVENVLRRRLNLDETERPIEYEERTQPQVNPSQASQYYPSQRNTQPQPYSATTPRGHLGRGRGRGAGQAIAQQGINRSVTTAPSYQNFDDMDDEDFLNDDMEAALDQIERDSTPPQPTSSSMPGSSYSGTGNINRNGTGNVNRNGTGNVNRNGTGNFNRNASGNNRTVGNIWSSGSSMTSFNSSGKKSGVCGNLGISNDKKIEEEFFNDDNDELFKCDFDEMSLSIMTPTGQKRGLDDFDANDSLSSRSKNMNLDNVQKNKDNMTGNLAGKLKSSFTPSKNMNLDSVQKHKNNMTGNLAGKLKGSFTPPLKKSSQLNPPSSTFIKPSTPGIASKLGPSRSPMNPKIATVKPKPQQSSLMNFVQRFPSKTSQNTQNNNNPLIGHDDAGNLEFRDENIESSTCKNSGGVEIDADQRTLTERVKNDPPFTYLCFLPKTPTSDLDVVVKGFIMTLLSRLEQRSGEWGLRVLINDGTGSRDVDIAPQVLNELIGVSVEDLKQRKADGEDKAKLKALLAKGVEECRHKLIVLSCLFHLHLSPSLPRPVLTDLTPFTSTHAQLLAHRNTSNLKGGGELNEEQSSGR